jgi:SOS-response transcriptional repressor LexA
MKRPLTKRQDQTLTFIKAYIRDNRIAPSYLDLMKGLGIKSKGHLWNLMSDLEAKGYIVREHGMERSITITADDDDESLLEQIRDAASAFIALQETYRAAYEADATSKVVKDKAPQVARAFSHLRELVEKTL